MLAIYPGSFDPPTVGHVEVIRRAARLFDQVYVAVMLNRAKHPRLSAEARVGLLQRCAGTAQNLHFIVSDAPLIDLARRLDATLILRGLRSDADYAVERPVADGFLRLYGIETLFMQSSPETAFISSSMARELLSFGKPPVGLIPAEIIDDVVNAYVN